MSTVAFIVDICSFLSFTKQENANTLTVLNRKRENEKDKYVIVFQLMKIIAKVKIRVKI